MVVLSLVVPWMAESCSHPCHPCRHPEEHRATAQDPEEHRATAQATSAAYVEIHDAADQDSVRHAHQWVVADVRTDEVPPTLVGGS